MKLLILSALLVVTTNTIIKTELKPIISTSDNKNIVTFQSKDWHWGQRITLYPPGSSPVVFEDCKEDLSHLYKEELRPVRLRFMPKDRFFYIQFSGVYLIEDRAYDGPPIKD